MNEELRAELLARRDEDPPPRRVPGGLTCSVGASV